MLLFPIDEFSQNKYVSIFCACFCFLSMNSIKNKVPSYTMIITDTNVPLTNGITVLGLSEL